MPRVPRPSKASATFYALITALVVFVAAVVSRYFWLYDKSLFWRTDGLGQAYPSLYVFNTWVRGMLASPASGVPMWSWDMGLGADIIGTLGFPILGDPFVLVSLLFPMTQLELAYTVMFCLRVVAVGIASAAYFRKMGARPLPAATGVVLYLFGTFLLVQGRHPFFITAMMFLPLLLLCVEIALRDRKTWPLALVTFLAAVSNYYFFYMFTIITVLYALGRYFELTEREKRWSGLLPTALRVGGAYAVGSALAAPWLLPALAAVSNTARGATEFDVGLLYPTWVYKSQIAAMTTGHFGAKSTFLGFGYLAWLMVPVLFLRRGRYTALKLMMVVFPVFVALPWFGSLFNGLTFPSNRFSFSWGLFLALGVALLLSEDEPLSGRDLLAMVVAYAAYVGPIVILTSPVPAQVLAPMAVGALTLAAFAVAWAAGRGRRGPTGEGAAVARTGPERLLGLVLLGLVVVNVLITGTFVHDRRFSGALDDFVDAGGVHRRYAENPGSQVADLPKGGFYRVDSGGTVHYNSSMVQGFPSTAYYFSAMNGNLTEFRTEIESRPGWSSFSYEGFDGRAMPTTLVGARYYVSENTDAARARVPFGFRLERQTPLGEVYVNDHALPLGFVYHDAIDRSDYLQLDPVDRQAAMLRGVVLDDGVAPGVPRVTPEPVAVEVPFSVAEQIGAAVDLESGRIVRTDRDSRIVLSIPPVTNAELYIEMRDFDNVVQSVVSDAAASGESAFEAEMRRRAQQPDELPTTYSAGLVRKTERWMTPDSPYYWGNRSQLVNLGYQRGEVTTIGIEPDRTGTLTFESLKVLALPLAEYPAAVEALRANAMTDIEVEPNRVSGRARLDRDGVLFLSIPFTSGWSAKVDGEAAETVRANTGFTGIPLPAGDHEVELRYVTPGLKPGLAIAALVMLGLGVALVVRRST